MRFLILIPLIIFCHRDSMAQSKPTKEETVNWLKGKLGQESAVAGKHSKHVNYTKMCVNFNLLPEANADPYVENPKMFRDKIVSNVSWKQDEMDLRNDIFINGKLKETYTYEMPLTGIVSAKISSCERNVSGNINAYVDRPVLIYVKKNSTKIGHQVFDKDGKAIAGKAPQYHMNSKDADWDSIIPIAGNWDNNADLQDKIVKAFARLGELNDKKVAVK